MGTIADMNDQTSSIFHDEANSLCFGELYENQHIFDGFLSYTLSCIIFEAKDVKEHSGSCILRAI